MEIERKENKRSRWRGLYAITPDGMDDASLRERVALVLAGRPALMQYRDKNASASQARRRAADLLALCRAAGVPLIVNDDLALALDIDADGVHLGRDDGNLSAARRALDAQGEGRILGVSCYDEWSRAEAAAAAGADYVAFGAMFASPTKPAARRAPFDLLGRARRELNVAVAAIGGVTLDNAATVFAAGADLVASISDVFGAVDPTARAAAYRALRQR
ncbi:MAG: thiamine phosphate synthase [Azoarcus sp.]|nr:thiamine phosphate synthase [Azoarcus sp.]